MFFGMIHAFSPQMSFSTAKIFNKGKTEKGVAFPTCVSVNNIAGHFAPPAENKAVLKEGDLVKVYVKLSLSAVCLLTILGVFSDLGTHVDGFAATAAHTLVLGGKPDARSQAQPLTCICDVCPYSTCVQCGQPDCCRVHRC